MFNKKVDEVTNHLSSMHEADAKSYKKQIDAIIGEFHRLKEAYEAIEGLKL